MVTSDGRSASNLPRCEQSFEKPRFGRQDSDNIIPTGFLHHNVSEHDSIDVWSALGRCQGSKMVPSVQNEVFGGIVHIWCGSSRRDEPQIFVFSSPRTPVTSFRSVFCITTCHNMIVLLFGMLWGDVETLKWFLASKMRFFDELFTFGRNLMDIIRWCSESSKFSVFGSWKCQTRSRNNFFLHTTCRYDRTMIWNTLGGSRGA